MEVMSLMQESLKVLHQSVGARRQRKRGATGDVDGRYDGETLDMVMKTVHDATTAAASAVSEVDDEGDLHKQKQRRSSSTEL